MTAFRSLERRAARMRERIALTYYRSGIRARRVFCTLCEEKVFLTKEGRLRQHWDYSKWPVERCRRGGTHA